MTSRELLSLVLRRWYLMLLGAIISVVALYLITHRPGVYWTHINVIVLAPVHKFYPNNLEDPDHSLAPMAGLLVADWNGTNRPPLMATGETTLYGQGLRQGIEVRVPNQGNQWQPLYFAPNIDVQVVGSTPEIVEQQAHRVRAELEGLLQKRQDAMGIQWGQRMTTMMSPTDPTIMYVSGSRIRAAAATGLVGAAVTTVIVYWAERFLFWNRSRRAAFAESTSCNLTSSPQAFDQSDSLCTKPTA
jgi:uncharacterized membrane protein